MAQATVESLEEAIETADGRQRSGLQKKLEAARTQVTVLDFQLAEQDKAERALWADLWNSPQAVAWERMGWARDVAQYVRHKVLGEMGSLDDAKESRQWSDRLGLNPKSMRSLLWTVAADEIAEQRATPTSARRRIKAV